ncbi:hypothetical protein FKM82_005954 [Ascaphus truei]
MVGRDPLVDALGKEISDVIPRNSDEDGTLLCNTWSGIENASQPWCCPRPSSPILDPVVVLRMEPPHYADLRGSVEDGAFSVAVIGGE